FPADVEILRRWLLRWRPQMAYVADYLDWVNGRIGSQDFAVGFSYFMRKDLDEDLLELIWAHSIVPSIEEYFFGDADSPSIYSLAQVRQAVNAAVEQALGDLETINAESEGSL